jgi:photosystem II stability/assembly factor-like uncharacterized protein
MTKSPGRIAFLFLGLAISLSWNSSSAQTNEHTVQIASYLTAADAQAAVNRLRAKKLDAYWVKAEIPGMGTRYRVRLGHYPGEDDATLGAAEACKSRAFNQYLIANGDSVPVGVPAKTCKMALAAAARLGPKPNKAEAVTSNSLTASSTKAVTPIKQPTTQPLTAPKAAEKMGTKQIASAATAPAVTAQPSSKSTGTNSVASATPKTVTVAAGKLKPPVFLPATSPKEIVANAYKYAADRSMYIPSAQASPLAKPLTKSAAPLEGLADINAPLVRSVTAPEVISDVAITNPKWKISQSNLASDKNLRAVHFVNASTGWAAGDGGAIFQTLDGGKQWSPIRNATLPGSVVDVNRIHFINENRGWMLAESRNREQSKTILLATEDGGKIWRHFELPNVTSFYFVDGKKGWAVGKNSTMMRTTDGGLKWKPVENLSRLVGLPVESASSKFGFSDVFFLKGGEIGWAVGNFYGASTTNIGGLFMTSDGGETWQRIPIAVQRKTDSTRFTKGILHTVRFTDVSNGVITGEIEDGNERFFFTLKTCNGGELWEQTRVPSSGVPSTQFVNSARGWTTASAARDDSAAAKVYDTILLRTDNGGKSWVPDFIAKGKQVRGVFFISPTRGWAVGDRGMILRYEAK